MRLNILYTLAALAVSYPLGHILIDCSYCIWVDFVAAGLIISLPAAVVGYALHKRTNEMLLSSNDE